MKLNRHQVYALDELFNSYDEGEIAGDEIMLEPASDVPERGAAALTVHYQLARKGCEPVSARLTTTGELTPAPGQED